MTAAVSSEQPAAPEQPAAWRRFFALDLLDNRYPALHGLRVIGIITVVQFHVTWIFHLEQGVQLDQAFVDGSLKIWFAVVRSTASSFFWISFTLAT